MSFDEHLVTTLNNDINLLKEDNKQLAIDNERLTAVAKNLAGSYVGLTKLAERLDASFIALAGPAHEMVVAVRKVTRKGSPDRADIQELTDSREVLDKPDGMTVRLLETEEGHRIPKYSQRVHGTNHLDPQ